MYDSERFYLASKTCITKTGFGVYHKSFNQEYSTKWYLILMLGHNKKKHHVAAYKKCKDQIKSKYLNPANPL